MVEGETMKEDLIVDCIKDWDGPDIKTVVFKEPLIIGADPCCFKNNIIRERVFKGVLSSDAKIPEDLEKLECIYDSDKDNRGDE